MTWRYQSWLVIKQITERLSSRMTKWVTEQTKVLKLQVRKGVTPRRARKARAVWNLYNCFTVKTKKHTVHRNVDKTCTVDTAWNFNRCENLGSLRRTSYILTALLCRTQMVEWINECVTVEGKRVFTVTLSSVTSFQHINFLTVLPDTWIWFELQIWHHFTIYLWQSNSHTINNNACGLVSTVSAARRRSRLPTKED